MRIDLHNHTTLCNHAEGSMSEYINKAKQLKIDKFGFSCHAPMNFDSSYRMSFDNMNFYLDNIHLLSENEKNIDILSAFEVDFILGREDLLDSRVIESNVDYLIGSVHFLGDWGFDNIEFIGKWQEKNSEEVWNLYLDSIQAMVKTRFFNIIGHFDLLKIFGHLMPISLENKLNKTLEMVKEYDLTIEINQAGLRKKIGELYPSENILQKIKMLNIDITFGSDAHSVEQVGYGYEDALVIAHKIGFKTQVYYKNRKKIRVPLKK